MFLSWQGFRELNHFFTVAAVFMIDTQNLVIGFATEG
jgi:hypothetical protein